MLKGSERGKPLDEAVRYLRIRKGFIGSIIKAGGIQLQKILKQPDTILPLLITLG